MKQNHKNTVWMRVTNDKYELPEAVADTIEELAQLSGVGASATSVYCTRDSKNEHSHLRKYKFLKVELDEEREVN